MDRFHQRPNRCVGYAAGLATAAAVLALAGCSSAASNKPARMAAKTAVSPADKELSAAPTPGPNQVELDNVRLMGNVLTADMVGKSVSYAFSCRNGHVSEEVTIYEASSVKHAGPTDVGLAAACHNASGIDRQLISAVLHDGSVLDTVPGHFPQVQLP